MRSFLYIITLFLLIGQVFAQKLLPSVEWQKTALKQQLENKVSDVLIRVLKPDEFFVNVRIDLATPQMPEFKKPKKPEDLNKEQAVRMGKVKPSDAALDSDPYGYIVFHKMGLEVPLVEDFKTESEAPKKEEENLEQNDFENIWKYNKAIDIYNNIDHIVFSIKVTNRLKSKDRPRLENLIKEIGFDIPGVQPDIKFDYVDFHMEKMVIDSTTNLPKKVEPTFFENLITSLEKFQYPITIITAVCLLGMFGLMLMKKYKQIIEETGPAATTMTMENSPQSEEDKDETDATVANQNQQAPIILNQTEMERFKLYLEQAPRECVAMVKTWIREAEKEQVLALSALVEELPNEKLTILVSHLSEEDKGKMRTIVQSKLKTDEVTQAKAFIGSQVRNEIIKGEKIDDPELQEMLLSLSPKNAARLMTDHTASIAILFGKLTPKFLSLILEQLDEASRASIVSAAITQQGNVDMNSFKEVLAQYAEVELYSPALEKIKLILPDANRVTEETLYSAIAQHGNTQSIKACALRHIPYQLVTKLPAELLKDALLSFDSVKRVEYLEILNATDKELLLNSFAPAGSKARDIYELDYERIFSDDASAERVSTNADSLAKSFIYHLRDCIKRNPQHTSRIEGIVSNWADLLIGQNSKRANLRVVA